MNRYWPVIAAILLITESSWAQRSPYGAYAENPNVPGQYGFTFNRDSHEQAEKIALGNCGDGCEIVDVFHGGCGALAIDEAQDGMVLGYASAKGSKDARAGALENCAARGGTACKKGKYGCNIRRGSGNSK